LIGVPQTFNQIISSYLTGKYYILVENVHAKYTLIFYA
jgi:hypothetical protein